jgi:hypothetical protein
VRALSSPWDRDPDNVVRMRPLRITAARLPDASSIAPRPWLYGTMLLKGFLSLLISPGGVGKSQVAMAIAASVASGKPLLGHHVHHRVNAWLMNLEDPIEEMERRLAALIVHHGIGDKDLLDRLFMDGASERGLTIAKVDEDGTTILFPDREPLLAAARSANIGLIVIDPFIRSHGLDENNNPHMDAAARAWAEIARELNCAILIVHHVRKGPVVDIDSARGGSALKDAARSAMLLSAMSTEDAEAMGISAAERWRYIRLDDGKANMAPKAEKADWLCMHPVQLHNGTPEYPNGDTVTALAAWSAPSVFKGLSSQQCNAFLDRIAAGYAPGVLFRPTQRGGASPRWAGNVLIGDDITEEQAKRIIKAWLASGLLYETTYRDADEGKERPGVLVDDSKRPT